MASHGTDMQTSVPGPDLPAGARPAIVGIGAGGLDALEALTRRLVAGGLAYVVMERVARRRPALTEFLARRAALPVATAADGMPVEADQIYIAPPGAEVTVRHGVLRLGAAQPGPGEPHPIDALLRTLADDLGHRAIGVILSGAGDDGALGLRAIKQADGITFVQDPATARQAGGADFVLGAEHIADELAWLSRHPYIAARRQQRLDDETRDRLFALLRRAFGVDFAGYRAAAIDRRIHRRMVLHKLTRGEDYLGQVLASSEELGALYGDLLFRAGELFRDPAQLEALATVVFPRLLADRPREAPVRIWVPGCGTGEEVYSIAICLLEYLGDRAADHEVQVFATDIDAGAIGRARHASYPPSIAHQVSPQRLERFFSPTDHGYQVQRAVRDRIVFAHHHLGDDPPFSRIDLVSCRHVLGALQPARQAKVLRDLHVALAPDGFLLLGADDTLADPGERFAPVAAQVQLYTCQASVIAADREREQPDPVARRRALEAENQALASPLPTTGEIGFSSVRGPCIARLIEAREHTRLELLARAGPLLAEPIEYETTLDAVVQLVVPVMADLCAIDLVEDDGALTKTTAFHPDPGIQSQLDHWLGTTPRDRLPGDLRTAIETAQPQLQLRDGAAERLPGDGPETGYRNLLTAIGATSAILAPLVVRGRVVGVLRLERLGPARRYLAQDLELAREVAHHAALAIERARLYREAQVAIAARDDLFAFVTHDLHNYVATIRMSATALTAQPGAAERPTGQKPVELIGRTVAHMARLIEGLRDATMIEAGRFTIATAAEDITALIRDAVETLAPQAEGRRLRLIAELTAELDDELPAVACDRDRVLQVIANLVGNAIKFTPPGGEIRIAAARSDGAVRISVSDTGHGIPASQLPRVFDRYWRGHPDSQGAGLGLFLARAIVDAHGGRIWVESAPGAGAAFHFTLPLAAQPVRSAQHDPQVHRSR